MASATMQGPATATITPHPVLLDGQRVGVELIPGETLAEFLRRAVPDDFDGQWEVRLRGDLVPEEMWDRVKPKDGAVIEVQGAVNRQALYLVAMIALTYFTMGTGTTAGAALFGASTTAAAVANVAIYVAGPVLIPKVIS